MRYGPLLLVASLFATDTATAQQQYDFDYLQAGYFSPEFDISSDTLIADGFSLNLSKEYKDRFLLTAEYAELLFEEDQGFRMEQEVFSVRLGYHFMVFEDVDLRAEIGYGAVDSNLDSGSEYHDGLDATIGIRLRPFERWEFAASLDHSRWRSPISLTGPLTTLSGEARWLLTDELSLGIGGTLGEYEHAWFGNFRYSFQPSGSK